MPSIKRCNVWYFYDHIIYKRSQAGCAPAVVLARSDCKLTSCNMPYQSLWASNNFSKRSAMRHCNGLVWY